MGVVVGVSSIAALSDGTIIPAPKFLKDSEATIKSAQRELSRKQKGFKNREKARVKLAKAWRKLTTPTQTLKRQNRSSLILITRDEQMIKRIMPLNLGDLRIKSSAIAQDAPIPKRYAGDGQNLSPPLEWSGAPRGTKEFALICHDPDAPLINGFTHWVLYGIPPTTTKLDEGQKPGAFTGGVSSAGRPGYMGPYPPSGHGPHHYYFWVYALDAPLGLKPGLTLDQLHASIDGHVLEQARLVGIYER